MDPMEDVLGLGLFKFEPDVDELVELYLLRRILGQQIPLEGEIIDDDPLSAPPWELLKKHKLEVEDDAFFFADGQTRHENGNRQKRTCVGGSWEGQKPRSGSLSVDGSSTEITWKKYMLNFHRTGVQGSTGWVMHEYSITSPEDLASSSHRLYHIRLNGYGQNSSLRGGGDNGGAQARADEEHTSAANSRVAAVDLVDDGDGFSETPYSDQDYQQYQCEVDSFQDPVVPGWLFFPGGSVGGPRADLTSILHGGGNTTNLGASATPSSESDQGAPGVMNEYGGAAAAPAAGMLHPFGQEGSSFSGAMDDLSFMDFEQPDFNIIDDFLAFPDPPCDLDDAPLQDQYVSQLALVCRPNISWTQLMPGQDICVTTRVGLPYLVGWATASREPQAQGDREERCYLSGSRRTETGTKMNYLNRTLFSLNFTSPLYLSR